MQARHEGYWSHTTLYHRGWTAKEIAWFLEQPDLLDQYSALAPPGRFYLIPRVLDAEIRRQRRKAIEIGMDLSLAKNRLAA